MPREIVAKHGSEQTSILNGMALYLEPGEERKIVRALRKLDENRGQAPISPACKPLRIWARKAGLARIGPASLCGSKHKAQGIIRRKSQGEAPDLLVEPTLFTGRSAKAGPAANRA